MLPLILWFHQFSEVSTLLFFLLRNVNQLPCHSFQYYRWQFPVDTRRYLPTPPDTLSFIIACWPKRMRVFPIETATHYSHSPIAVNEIWKASIANMHKIRIISRITFNNKISWNYISAISNVFILVNVCIMLSYVTQMWFITSYLAQG